MEIKNKDRLSKYIYYENENGILLCGDNAEIMPLLEDNSIDMILTDPPYGINYLSNMTKNHNRLKNDSFDDWVKCLPQWLTQFQRVIKKNGCCCCFCSGGGKTPVSAIFTLEAIKYFNLIQTLIWKKLIGLGWKYRPAYETVVILSKSKDDYNFYDTSKACSNVIEGINQDIPTKDDHPTQKPVKLMEKLLLIHSLKDDLVLDPFSGGGSTLIACEKLNRRWIGIEISEEYCEIAKKRIHAEHSQLNMF